MSKAQKSPSGLQGIVRLLTDATIGVTELVEEMHHHTVHPPYLPSTPVQHLITNIAGFTYNNIKRATRFIGGSLDKSLGLLAPILGEIKTTHEREAIHAALNGVLGDYLEEHKNPLKITMQFRYQAKVVSLNRKSLKKAYPNCTGKILLMIHGSSMNDMQWTRKGHNHGTALAKELDKTSIYLHYNSGRHISTNGQDLSSLLEDLILAWPVTVEELIIVTHSIGGLVARSAMHYAQQGENNWIQYLQKIVFLGTPHHGAPLERAGSYLHTILELIPYTKPFMRLGKIRSAGVTDLRYGNLVDEDWQDNDRFKIHNDNRQNIPLPKNIDCYSVAGDNGKQGDMRPRFIGDGLVDVKSALGQHKNPDKDLHFKKENTWIAYETNHLDLLSKPEIYDKIKIWLS